METYAIVIGVEHYEDKTFHPLQGATNDAKEFHRWLVDPKGGATSNEACTLLLSNDGFTALFLKTIEDSLDQIINKAAKSKQKKKRFIFYFSGHGFGINIDDVALVPTDWSQTRANRLISSRSNKLAIIESGIFDEFFLFLDCCRSRKPNLIPQGTCLYSPSYNQNGKKTQSLIAYATGHWEAAYQETIGTNSIPFSYFTKALLNGLKGGAALPNGKITLLSLKGYLVQTTKNIAIHNGNEQNVQFEDTFTNSSTEIVKVPPLLYRYEIPLNNLSENENYTMKDGRLEPIITWSKKNKVHECCLFLPTGKYIIYNGKNEYIEHIVEKYLITFSDFINNGLFVLKDFSQKNIIIEWQHAPTKELNLYIHKGVYSIVNDVENTEKYFEIQFIENDLICINQ